MKKMLLAATAAISLVPIVAEAATVLQTTGYWKAVFDIRKSDNEPMCTVEADLQREKAKTKGWIMIASFTDGSAYLAQFSEDWGNLEGKRSTAYVSIDGARWPVTVEGGDHFLNMTVQDSHFWDFFVSGKTLKIEYPHDLMEMSLIGSRGAYNKMNECWNQVNGGGGSVNPLGNNASRSDPI